MHIFIAVLHTEYKNTVYVNLNRYVVQSSTFGTDSKMNIAVSSISLLSNILLSMCTVHSHFGIPRKRQTWNNVCKKFHLKMEKNATKTFNIMKVAFKKQQTIKKHRQKFWVVFGVPKPCDLCGRCQMHWMSISEWNSWKCGLSKGIHPKNQNSHYLYSS